MYVKKVAMEDARPILRSLREIGSEMMTFLVRYAPIDYKFYRKRTEIAIDSFDTEFAKLNGMFPSEVPQLTEAEVNLAKTNGERLAARREKVYNRYAREMDQDEQKCQRMFAQVSEREETFLEGVKALTRDFDAETARIQAEYNEKKSEKERVFNERMAEIVEKIGAVERQQEAEIAAEEEKVGVDFAGQAEQKRASALELEKSVAEIDQERQQRLEEFERMFQRLHETKEREIEELNAAHDKRMEQVEQRQKAVQQAILSVEERISTMEHKALLVKSNHDGRRSFMRNSMLSQHALSMKKAQAQVDDMKAKIAQTERLIEAAENVSLDAYKDRFDMMEQSIQYEISTRDATVEGATSGLRRDYEKKVAEQKEKLRALDAEISDNQLMAIKMAAMNQEKLNEKISELQSHNQREIDNLNGELSRINGYLSKVHGEWSSLKNATQKIFEHRMNELQHEMERRKQMYADELVRIAEERKAIEDSTDYEKLLKDELDDVEKRYLDDEKLIEDEKVRLLNITIEEEKMRGALSTRKQCAEEMNILKESENELKAKLLELSQELLKLETMLNDETAVFTNDQQAKLQSAIRRFEEELEQERKRLEEELARLREEIKNMKRASLEKEKELAQLQKKLAPPKEEDRIAREKQIREEFDKRSSVLMASIEELRRDIAALTEQINQLTQEMNDEKKRGDFAKQKLEDLRETFQKSVDRVNDETRAKYGRMVDTVQTSLRKLQEAWQKEEDNLNEKIRQRTEELELLEKMFQMHISDLNSSTQRKISELQKGKGSNYQAEYDNLAAEFKAEEDKLRKEVEDEALEFGKQERWKQQDNKMLLKKDQEEYEKELAAIRKANSQIKSEISDLQHAIQGRLKWTCPDCQKREKEIKDIKAQILSIVQKMHETEKEDANRIYAAAHFGQSTRTLPRLRAASEVADVY